MKIYATRILTCLALTALPQLAWSQTPAANNAPVAAPVAAPLTAAEVRKVDRDTMKITLKHEEIKNLEMPAMTMVFQVKDVALLEKVKAGDKVKFAAEKSRGGYAVTHIEVSK